MARTLTIPAPDVSLLGPEREPLLDLSINVVTPLFGGSATPRETDARNPVRAASVRGHLRFWWRACRGAQYTSVDELFKEEERIWGSTKQPGRLAVRIQTLNAGREVSQPLPSFLAYALFPFQENKGENRPAASGREGVRFRLRIELAAMVDGAVRLTLQEDAAAAVWAWLTFGGIGARTRRGCGSLFCSDARFRPDTAEPSAWLRQMAARYIASGERRLPIPVLHTARIVAGSKREQPLRSWQQAVDLLREFRQAPVGRPEGKVPGRSRWPEAESIRDIARNRRVSANAYFPRADLGLPIVTHFKQGKTTREPPNSTL